MAQNEDGRSVWSDVVSYQTKADVPGAPHKPVIKGKISSNGFKLAWGKCYSISLWAYITFMI